VTFLQEEEAFLEWGRVPKSLDKGGGRGKSGSMRGENPARKGGN